MLVLQLLHLSVWYRIRYFSCLFPNYLLLCICWILRKKNKSIYMILSGGKWSCVHIDDPKSPQIRLPSLSKCLKLTPSGIVEKVMRQLLPVPSATTTHNDDDGNDIMIIKVSCHCCNFTDKIMKLCHQMRILHSMLLKRTNFWLQVAVTRKSDFCYHLVNTKQFFYLLLTMFWLIWNTFTTYIKLPIRIPKIEENSRCPD